MFVKDGPKEWTAEDEGDGSRSIDRILEEAMDATGHGRTSTGPADDAEENALEVLEEDSGEPDKLEARAPPDEGASSARLDQGVAGSSERATASREEGPLDPRHDEDGPVARDHEPPGGNQPARTYPGGFTRQGLVLAGIAIASLMATLLVVRWDTLFLGADYEAIGRMQWTAILLGLVVFLTSATFSVVDIVRASREAT